MIQCNFTLPFFKLLLGLPVNLQDLNDIDADFTRHLKFLFSNRDTIDSMYLDFSVIELRKQRQNSFFNTDGKIPSTLCGLEIGSNDDLIPNNVTTVSKTDISSNIQENCSSQSSVPHTTTISDDPLIDSYDIEKGLVDAFNRKENSSSAILNVSESSLEENIVKENYGHTRPFYMLEDMFYWEKIPIFYIHLDIGNEMGSLVVYVLIRDMKFIHNR